MQSFRPSNLPPHFHPAPSNSATTSIGIIPASGRQARPSGLCSVSRSIAAPGSGKAGVVHALVRRRASLLAIDLSANGLDCINQCLTGSDPELAGTDKALDLICKRAKQVAYDLRTPSIQARNCRAQLVEQAVRLALGELPVRDQGSDVAHQELNGRLWGGRGAQDPNRTVVSRGRGGSAGGVEESQRDQSCQVIEGGARIGHEEPHIVCLRREQSEVAAGAECQVGADRFV